MGQKTYRKEIRTMNNTATNEGTPATTPTLTETDLRQFHGTETWFRHWGNRSMTYTEGVQYMAERGGAYWLIDEIAISQSLPAVKREEFQVWTLTLSDADTKFGAVLTCDDGNDNIVYTKKIPFTDFPLSTIKFYCTDNVIMLPGEY
ncbi:MAG: hypothetical protein FWD64_05525 [Acidobacteriaceae bacterium]|nr:hypothetical protein [Acidobacteriaceae bacterium]